MNPSGYANPALGGHQFHHQHQHQQHHQRIATLVSVGVVNPLNPLNRHSSYGYYNQPPNRRMLNVMQHPQHPMGPAPPMHMASMARFNSSYYYSSTAKQYAVTIKQNETTVNNANAEAMKESKSRTEPINSYIQSKEQRYGKTSKIYYYNKNRNRKTYTTQNFIYVDKSNSAATQQEMKADAKADVQQNKKEKLTGRHNPAHRNSTSSEATGSEDLNSSSGNEDHSPAFMVQCKSTKKTSNSRQKRQQKRKQLNSAAAAAAATTTTAANGATKNCAATTPMDVDAESANKENRTPTQRHTKNASKHNQSSSSAPVNLRKQCTKAAALKAALKKNNPLSTSASNSSVSSTLSSAASSTSSSSSSASSSPTHSSNSSPTASPTVTKRNADHLKKVALALAPPLRQFYKLNLSEHEIVDLMERYVLDPSLLKIYGFPVPSQNYKGCVEMYKCLPKHLAEEAITQDNQRHHRHFYGRKKNKTPSKSSQWYSSSPSDSGLDSGMTDSDSSDMMDDEPITAFYTPDGVYQIFAEYNNSEEKRCVRCSKEFRVSEAGEYLSTDECIYHWGKLGAVYNGKCYVNTYSCCQGEEHSEGCAHNNVHVWNGYTVGVNGPYNDFVHTKPRSDKSKYKRPKVYALDCEMSYTGLGLEATKVTVVGCDGTLVYEQFVKPKAAIVDYNTRFSGICESDLSGGCIKTFEQVQQDLLQLFDSDTILIGHGLDNDLRVLRMVHRNVVDTSLVFNHSTGYPYRRSLKNLTNSFLFRDIQCNDTGHSSLEDSRACLELMLWKLRKDLRNSSNE